MSRGLSIDSAQMRANDVTLLKACCAKCALNCFVITLVRENSERGEEKNRTEGEEEKREKRKGKGEEKT